MFWSVFINGLCDNIVDIYDDETTILLDNFCVKLFNLFNTIISKQDDKLLIILYEFAVVF